MLLAPGEAHTALADQALIPIWEPVDEVVELRGLRRLHHEVRAGADGPIRDVLLNASGVDEDVLLDDADIVSDAGERCFTDVDSVERDPSRRDVVIPGDEVRERRLSAARRTPKNEARDAATLDQFE